MNRFKKILLLIVLFTINIIYGRSMGQLQAPQPISQEQPVPGLNKPIIQPIIPPQLREQIQPIPQIKPTTPAQQPKPNRQQRKPLQQIQQTPQIKPTIPAQQSKPTRQQRKPLQKNQQPAPNSQQRGQKRIPQAAQQIKPTPQEAKPLIPRNQRRQPAPRMQPSPSSTQAILPKPIAVKKMEHVTQPLPTQNYAITNNVVMTLDPREKETVEKGAESMVQTALIALYQKAAPVIMTTNVFEIILTVQQQIGEQNLQALRSFPPMQQFNEAQKLLQKVKVGGISSLSIFFLAHIIFDANNLNCYFHKSEKLVLLIPKEYIQANIPKAIHLSLNDQARACGFNPEVLRTITEPTAHNLLKQLQIEKTRQEEKDKFIFHLTSMFTIQKKNDVLISPERDNKWIIYITGHGSPAHLTIEFVRGQLAMMQSHLANPKNVQIIDPKTQKQIPTTTVASMAKEYEEMLEGRSDWLNTQHVPESAQIAGITGSDFVQLMTFFDASLDTGYVHYTTCFAGGSNQTFVNETLSELNVHFIASSQGIQEGYTSSQVKIGMRSDKPGVEITGQNFAEFFRLLRMFFTEQKEFAKIKGKNTEPLQIILQTISSDDMPQNQPFVRLPGAGSFEAVSLSKSTKVLTKAIVKAHEIEKKPIDIRSADIDVLLINTPRIGVPLNLGKETASGHTAIVFPSPQSFTPAYEAINICKEINFEGTLQSFLFHSTYLNARMYPQTFIVNTLKGITYQESGLSSQQGTIKNLIIQMKSVPGKNGGFTQPLVQSNPITQQDVKIGTIGLNVHVYFELNQKIYQCMFAIKNFEDSKNLSAYMKQITFNAQPIKSANMNMIASNLLTPQEITKVAKPVTLESIAEYFDDKINEQDPSMAIWSEADEKALLKFAKDHVKK